MYVRPRTVDEALDCLSEPGAVVIGGGTKVNPTRPVEPVLIVDLQALGLDGVDARADGVLTVGATTTLQQLVDEPAAPTAVRDAARREAPSTLRTLATVGGCVATADPASELLAALLVHDARVSIVSPNGTRTLELAALLADRGRLTGGIITGLTLQADGTTSIARTGRTRAGPCDRCRRRAPHARRRRPAGGHRRGSDPAAHRHRGRGRRRRRTARPSG